MMNIPPDDNTPGHPTQRPFSVGEALAEARKQMGLSVADVANRLKFAPRQIEALETDNFARLPEIAFVRGFVRSYARLLQLDPLPLLAALPQPPAQASTVPEIAAEGVPFPHTSSSRKLNIRWLVAGIVVALILVLFVLLHEPTTPKPREPEAAPIQTTVEPLALPAGDVPVVTPEKTLPSPVATPVPVSAVKPTAKPTVQPAVKKADPAGALIYLTFEEDSWVEVSDKDSKPLMGQLNLGGTERRINGDPPFSLLIGNASHVRLYYRGKPIDLTPYNRAGVAHLTLE